MLEGINNSGQKRLQIYAPWNGQSGTGSSISAQNTEIGDWLGGVKLPTKEQIEASLKKVQKNKILTSQDYDELWQKLLKNLKTMPKNGLKLKEPDENIISPNSDLGKKIADVIDSRNNSAKLMLFPSLADDYVPVYKPVTDTDGKQMGPWPEYVLVGYRAKTPNEKKGVELY